MLPVILGHDNTLRCPVDSPSAGADRSVKAWFRGPVSNTEAFVARLITSGGRVEYNYTVDEKMWISSVDGELFIQNLTLEDVGFYTCYFTGSKEQTIKLYVRGMFIRSFSDRIIVKRKHSILLTVSDNQPYAYVYNWVWQQFMQYIIHGRKSSLRLRFNEDLFGIVIGPLINGNKGIVKCT